MPIELKQRERGIYTTLWKETVTLDEMAEAQELGRKLADEDDLSHYIMIFDMSAKPRIPTDIRQTGRLIAMDETVLRTVIVGGSESLKLFSSTLMRVFKQMNPIEHFDTMEEALIFARELLSEIQSGTA